MERFGARAVPSVMCRERRLIGMEDLDRKSRQRRSAQGLYGEPVRGTWRRAVARAARIIAACWFIRSSTQSRSTFTASVCPSRFTGTGSPTWWDSASSSSSPTGAPGCRSTRRRAGRVATSKTCFSMAFSAR